MALPVGWSVGGAHSRQWCGLRHCSLAHHAGVAHAIAGFLAAFPCTPRAAKFTYRRISWNAGAGAADVSGRLATPALRAALAELRGIASDHLAEAGRLLGAVPPDLLPALFPVALVPTMLERMARDDPFAPKEYRHGGGNG